MNVMSEEHRVWMVELDFRNCNNSLMIRAPLVPYTSLLNYWNSTWLTSFWAKSSHTRSCRNIFIQVRILTRTSQSCSDSISFEPSSGGLACEFQVIVLLHNPNVFELQSLNLDELQLVESLASSIRASWLRPRCAIGTRPSQ